MTLHLSQERYVGRFAPSPTGPLHMGSLVTAMASYLDAKKSGIPHSKWLIRIEDVDTPRTAVGATDQILRALDELGFEWDGPIVYQSERSEYYVAAIEQLSSSQPDNLFKCLCSRTEQPGLVYDGRCRSNRIGQHFSQATSIRLRVANQIQWVDRSGLAFNENLETSCGDFVLKRRDNLWAYQLAVVVDDELQGVTDIVRGKDLIDSTARQIYLQTMLGYKHQSYWHVPLVLSASGEKLSKQTGARGLNLNAAVAELQTAWGHLNTQPIEAITVNDFWHQALEIFVRPDESAATPQPGPA